MKLKYRLIAGGAVVASMFTGGVIGATVLGPMAASAASASTSTTPAAAATAAPGAPGAPGAGAFTPNEDATHEAGESAAREAQENTGQMPTIP